MRASSFVPAGLLFVLAACTATRSTPPPHLLLDTDGGDVWAWEQTVRGTAVGCDKVWVTGPGGSAEVASGRFEAVVPLVPGDNVLSVRCGDSEAVQTWTARLDPEPLSPRSLDRDWRDAIVYGVVPFFFGEGRFGDVIERLPHLEALGVDALWLSPVARAAEGDFGYAVTDHHALRDTFGSEEDFEALVAAAHARDMAVFVDLALNHSSDAHPYFRSAVEDPRSPYRSFYVFDEQGRHGWYFDWENLPNLDYDEPQVRNMVLDALTWWVKRFGVDGFRLDAIWGVERRAPGFVAQIRQQLGPDLFLLAEASVRDGIWGAMGYDAAYDWTDDLGVWAWREAFEDTERTAERLRAAIETETDVPVFRFIDNNDTGARFVTRYGVERTRVAAALLMTLPGIPVVFTGTEVGAELAVYAEGPPLAWEDPHGLVATWTEWIGLRKAHEALRRGSMSWLDAPEHLLAYSRALGDEEFIVVLDFSGRGGELAPLPYDVSDVRSGQRHLAGEVIPVSAFEAKMLSVHRR